MYINKSFYKLLLQVIEAFLLFHFNVAEGNFMPQSSVVLVLTIIHSIFLRKYTFFAETFD